MSTEIALPSTPPTLERAGGPSVLAEQMSFARAVAVGSLLPETYRNKPANVLIAVGLGSAMGLSPAESLYRIDVISGKPTASAELIAANVRKAGHKLRVKGDDESCTATIIRKDDQDFEFTVTRDVAWAQAMGLANKDNYKKQRGTMLQWRAISAVARLACPEALYGVSYTPDELYDTDTPREAPVRVTAAQIIGDTTPPASDEGTPEKPLTDHTRKRMFALLTERGITDAEEQRRGMAHILERPIGSRSELTEADALAVIATLNAPPETPPDVDPATGEVSEEFDPTTEPGWGERS